MLKKSSVLLSCSNLHSFHPSCSSTSKTSSKASQTTRRPARQQQQCRLYAMISDGHTRHSHDGIRWPEKTSADALPTPYQIFNQKKGSPYSKQRFYELVKLYHPDRHGLDQSSDGVPQATKLERYRLVIAANDILSDPVRRGAYDCYGAGWNGQPDVHRSRDASDQPRWDNYDGRGWGSGPGGPSQNATWEDWEKWYQKEAGGPQEPRYVSNSAFVSLVVIFAALGGVGQATRGGKHALNFLEQRDAVHDNISKDLVRIRNETMTMFGSREERIHSFLRQRDSMRYGAMPSRYEKYRKLPPAPEEYSSEGVKQQPMDIYHPKSNPTGD